MTVVFSDSSDAPVRRLTAHEVLTPSALMAARYPEGLIETARGNLAARALRLIVESPDLFKFSEEATSGMVTIKFDCIVLSMDEYDSLCRRKFQEGLRHAQHFRPERAPGEGPDFAPQRGVSRAGS